jgi:hypothetical protein
MKQSILLFLSMLMLLSACKKSITNEEASSNDLINAAKSYFGTLAKTSSSTIPRFASTRAVEWDKAEVTEFQGKKTVIARVQYLRAFYMGSSVDARRLYNSNEITWICIYKDSFQQYHTEQVAFFPDSSFIKNGKFSGLIAVDDWTGASLHRYLVRQDGSIWQNQGNAIAGTHSLSMDATQNLTVIIQTCYEYYGYNYSVADPNGGIYWSEPAGCSYTIVNGGGGGAGGPTGSLYRIIAGGGSGGGGTSGISPAANFSILSGTNIIANIIDYNKCFTNIAGNGNTYSVTVCVDQPEPGASDAWTVSATGAGGSSAGGNPANVGHTFLIFMQNTGGEIITRNVGFYPATLVSPRTPTAVGEFNNDALHGFNVSLTVQVTNSQFFNMLNYVSQQTGSQYDLNANNCTSFALKTLDAGEIFLPSTIGTWPGGSGNDPGDLGQDILSLNLSSNMSRNMTSSNHPNLGSCN